MPATRREFVKLLGTAGLVSLAGPAPRMWSTVAAAASAASAGRILVLVQMAGGNDGLNTVVPISNDAYYRARPALAIGQGSALKLNDELGLHPAMTGFRDLWDAGRLAIVEGVGYPHPDRSHFRSMDVWHAADTAEVLKTGWVGRALDATISAPQGPWEAMCLGMDRLPLACLGERVVPPTIQRVEEFRLESAGKAAPAAGSAVWKQALQESSSAGGGDLEFLRRSARSAVSSAERLASLAGNYRSSVSYPSSGLAQRLKLVAQMITADLPARIYFVSIEGFDTHSQQLPGHAALLGELSGAVSAFIADLDEHGRGQEVLVATFSEFGRRVAENGSLGTDHGAASVSLAITPAGKGGLYGQRPSLIDLDDGDPKFTTDFRRVYATLLERWLERPAAAILGDQYAPLEFA